MDTITGVLNSMDGPIANVTLTQSDVSAYTTVLSEKLLDAGINTPGQRFEMRFNGRGEGFEYIPIPLEPISQAEIDAIDASLAKEDWTDI